MAKISTYPILSTPTVNDLLIGTDVENLNETKNFSIGDIGTLIGQDYVPYVGATGNVNLGSFNITGGGFIVGGGTASQFLKADGSLDSTLYTPQTRTLTINGTTYNLSANRSWDLNTIDSLTTTGTSGAATYVGKVLNIPVYQAQGSYITQLSGEATGSGPGNATVTLDNAAVISKILTGLNVTGGTVVSTDTILQAFGKIQNQINGLAGGVEYQGVWNAATNTPFLQSSVGTQGHYYVVDVAGNTNLNGITDWQLGDWAIYNGSVWQKVDNTDAVVSVNGYVGAVVLTASDVGAVPTTRTLTINGVGYNLSADRAWTVGDVRTDGSYANPSWITSLAWSKITSTPTTLAGYGITDGALNTTTLTINGTTYDLTANRTWNVGTVTSVGTSGPLTGGTITGSGTIGITQAGTSTDGYLSSTDWNAFNSKQGSISVNAPLTFVSGVIGITQSSSIVDGYLSSTDWNTFNSKVSGSGTANTLPMWGSASSLINSPLSYALDTFNFQYNSSIGGTVNFTNIGLTAYTYSIQMNNFGSPRSTIHSYTDGLIIQSIGGTQVSRMFANGNLILGTGTVDNGYKLEVTGDLYLNTIANAATDTDRFIVSDGGLIKYRTGAQVLSDIGAQGALTLTTTGSSGPATLIGDTLNIPEYSSSLTGYVPYTGATQNVNLGEYGLTGGYFLLDTTPTGTPTSQGTIYWDDSKSTAALIMNGTIQHIGQDTYFYVKNSTGSSIPKGTAVRFAGTDGASGHLLIAPFLADGTYPSSYFMGVTSETIANGAFGQVSNFGELSGINTSAYAAGDLLYASTTVAGGFQTTPPVAPNNIVLVAAAVNSKNNGDIVVRPLIGSNINNDEGVKIVSPVTGQLLQLQSNGLWENKTLAQVLGGTSSQFVKGDGSLDSNTYLTTSAAASTYVPYTGATGAVDLGTNAFAASQISINGASPTSGSFLGFKHATTVNTGANGYTSMYTFGTNIIGFKSINGANNIDFSFDMSAITPNVPGGRVYTLPNASGTIALVGGSGVGTVTSVAALTLGTSGTDLSSTVANSTTTPVITLNVPTASATNRGALSSSDWTTFNNKQDALTNPVTGTGTTNYLPKFTGSTTIGNSNLVDVNGYLVLGGTSSVYGQAGRGTFEMNGSADNIFAMRVGGSLTGYLYTNASSMEIYSTNKLDISTNGAVRATITTGGNLLVGTTTDAGYKLDVNGTGRYLSGSSSTIGLIVGGAGGAGSTRQGQLRFGDAGSVYKIQGGEDYSAFNFMIGTGTPLTITSSGNVGIGTTSPAYKLVLESASTTYASSPSVAFYDTVVTADARNWMIGNIATDYGSFNIASSTTQGGVPQTPRLTINRIGNVGIGTSSPVYKFVVSKGGAEGMEFDVGGISSGKNYIINYNRSTGSYVDLSIDANNIFFIANSTERMRITSSGNVGIGTSTFAYSPRLAVASVGQNSIAIQTTDTVQGSAGTILYLGTGASTGNSTFGIIRALGNGGTSATNLVLQESGNVLIGTTTDSGARLQVSGEGRFTSNLYTSTALYINTTAAYGFRINSEGNNGFYNRGGSTAAHYPFLLENSSGALLFQVQGTGAATFSSSVTTLGSVDITGEGNTLTLRKSTNVPALTFIGASSNTIIEGGNTFNLYTGGAGNRIFVTSTGNVGIGTASPSVRLQAENTINTTYSSSDTLNGGVVAFIKNASTTNSTDATIRLEATGSSNVAAASISAVHVGAGSSDLTFGTRLSAGNVTERMRITSGGNVLIGTTTDSGDRVNVNGSIRVPQTFFFRYDGDTGIFGSATSITGGSASQLGIRAASDILFATNGANERMRITSGGNVGIGSTGPITRLSLGSYTGSRLPYIYGTGNTFNANGITVTSSNSADTAIGGGLDLTNNVYSVNSASPIISFSSLSLSGAYNNSYAAIWGTLLGPGGDANWNVGALVFGTASSYGIVERMRIKNTGDVGIGTDNPLNKFAVIRSNTFSYYNRADAVAVFQGFLPTVLIANDGNAGDQYAELKLGNNQTTYYTYSAYIRGVQGSGIDQYRLEFGTSASAPATTKMTLTTGGNLLIGTTTDAGYTLNVAGNAQIVRSGTSTALVAGLSGVTGSIIRFSYNGGFVGSISTDGSNTSYNTSSDYRLKQDIKDFNGLDLLSRIKPYDFEWKSDKTRSYGVLAHELQEVINYAVTGSKDAEEMQGVDYSKLVPILIKAIQELNEKIK